MTEKVCHPEMTKICHRERSEGTPLEWYGPTKGETP